MFARKPIPVHDLKTTRTGEVRRRSIFWRWRRLFFLIGLLMATGTAGVALILSQVELPNDGVVAPENQTSYLCDASVQPGTPCTASNAIAAFHGDENRQNVKLDQIPKVLQNAVLSAEDRDYFNHDGVNPQGIARAAYQDIRSGSQQGGSTITQQYVKNVFLSNERTLTRKLKEGVMAMKLEQKIGKEDILERYLNVIYFGRGAYGVQAASQAYFKKDVKDLLLHDAALLAGLIRSPNSAEPYEPSEKAEAKRRRHTVLVAMEEEGHITKAELEMADAVPLDLNGGVQPPKPSTGVDYLRGHETGTEYFVEYVRKQLVDKYGNAALYGGGMRIYTTLEPGYQAAAWTAVTDTLNQPGDPAGSLVAIDDKGYIKAMMGGRWFGEGPNESTVNLATGTDGGGSGRQPGSTFKAFALAEAVIQGYSIESKFEAPKEIKIPTPGADEDFWKVKGGCCEEQGFRADLVTATQKSVNTVYAQLMMDLGPDKVIKTAKSLGITSEMQPYPSIVLGTGSVSVLDMASAYSTFQNNGTHIEPTSIVHVELADGTAPAPPEARRSQVLSPEQCAKVVYALQKVTEKGGTGAAANFGRPAAGKTGTTQDNKDAWFVGFTPRLTAAVWMGYEIPKEMVEVHGQSVQGGNLPSQVWKKFMMAVANTDVGPFPKPKGDVASGRLMHPELNTTTTQAPPPTPPPPPSTDRPRPDPTWPRPTWPKPTWPTTTERPGNGNPKPPTTPSTPSTRGPGTLPPGDDD